MSIAVVWGLFSAAAILYGAATGRAESVSNAALEGAKSAITLCLAIGGPMCLWSAVMELMQRSGLSASLSRALRPILGRLFPSSRRDVPLMEDLSHNLSANLLGLGNAATPAGIRAAMRLHPRSDRPASDELCRLVVLNTASVQLLPTTVAAVRAAAGAGSAFDILPAVWLSSLISVAVGLLLASLFASLSQ
jgi:spore maturation protein A